MNEKALLVKKGWEMVSGFFREMKKGILSQILKGNLLKNEASQKERKKEGGPANTTMLCFHGRS